MGWWRGLTITGTTPCKAMLCRAAQTVTESLFGPLGHWAWNSFLSAVNFTASVLAGDSPKLLRLQGALTAALSRVRILGWGGSCCFVLFLVFVFWGFFFSFCQLIPFLPALPAACQPRHVWLLLEQVTPLTVFLPPQRHLRSHVYFFLTLHKHYSIMFLLNHCYSIFSDSWFLFMYILILI